MTLNCIWWWNSSPGDLEYVEYNFIAITSKSTLLEVLVLSMVQIDLLNYLTVSKQITDVKLNC